MVHVIMGLYFRIDGQPAVFGDFPVDTLQPRGIGL
jgi:hypothetical protein